MTVADPCARCGIDVPPGRILCRDCATFEPDALAVYDRRVLAARERAAAYYERNRETVRSKQRARNAQRAAAQRARRAAS